MNASPADRAAAAAARDRAKTAAGVDKPGPIKDNEVGIKPIEPVTTTETAGATTVTDRERPLQTRPTNTDPGVDAYEADLAKRRSENAPQQSLPITTEGRVPGLPSQSEPTSVKDALAEQMEHGRQSAQATGYTDARRVSAQGGDPAVPLATHQRAQSGARSGLPRMGKAR